mmetsp:Transcript_89185/g.277275  ORF Transcript_89185/g.277275 Transcript_89185/m.277275 type:complete len:234 (+) Transcript_89185:154-855(+)
MCVALGPRQRDGRMVGLHSNVEPSVLSLRQGGNSPFWVCTTVVWAGIVDLQQAPQGGAFSRRATCRAGAPVSGCPEPSPAAGPDGGQGGEARDPAQGGQERPVAAPQRAPPDKLRDPMDYVGVKGPPQQGYVLAGDEVGRAAAVDQRANRKRRGRGAVDRDHVPCVLNLHPREAGGALELARRHPAYHEVLEGHPHKHVGPRPLYRGGHGVAANVVARRVLHSVIQSDVDAVV